MTYKPPYPYVEVVWEDATSNNDAWINIKDEEVSTEMVITRGWLVLQKEGWVSIANSVSAHEHGEDIVGNVATIPRGMIRAMREIKVANLRKKKIKPVIVEGEP